MRTRPACPFRTTSASAIIMRTVNPQPDAHSVHTLGFIVAMPGMMSSSGTKRMISFSGLPQLASAALVPVTAVSLMKERRSIRNDRSTSEMTSQTVVRSLALAMTVHTKAHRHVHVSLRGALRFNVAVAGRALDVRANVRRVIEPDVRLRGISEHSLPREVAPFFAHLGNLPDARVVRRDSAMTRHAGPHARESRDRSFGHRLVTVLGARDAAACVSEMRELERLLDDNRMP